VPHGYDRWRKVGIVRNPVERLWSLYKYLQRIGLDWCLEHDAAYTADLRASVEVPFEEWLVRNEVPFTTPYDRAGLGRYFAPYTVRHPLPENRKSQFVYLRPDLGTEIWPYARAHELHGLLGVSGAIRRENGTPSLTAPRIQSDEAVEYLYRWFDWDFRASGSGSAFLTMPAARRHLERHPPAASDANSPRASAPSTALPSEAGQRTLLDDDDIGAASMADIPSTAWAIAVTAMATALDAKPLPAGISDAQVGHWSLKLNNGREPLDCVPGFSIEIKSTEYLAFGLLHPAGGMIGGWSEDRFILEMAQHLTAEDRANFAAEVAAVEGRLAADV